MCQIHVDKVGESGKTRKEYFYTWTCCNCNGFWSLLTNDACLSCGHWRCRTASTSTSSWTALPVTREPPSQETQHSGVVPQVPSPRAEHVQARTLRLGDLHPLPGPEAIPPSDVLSHQKSSAPSLIQSRTNDAMEIDTKHPSPAGRHGKHIGEGEASGDKASSNTSGLTLQTPDTGALIPDFTEWREVKTAPGFESDTSDADTPSSSGDSYLSPFGEAQTPVASSQIGDLVHGLDIDPDEEGSDSEESKASSFVDVETLSVDDLLQRTRFHRVMRRIIHTFSREWWGTRTRGQSPPEPQSSTSGDRELFPGAIVTSDRGRKRKERDEEGDPKRQTDPEDRPKRSKDSAEYDDVRSFACPFCKKDLQQYPNCAKFRFTKVQHVKQHIHRNHDAEVDNEAKQRLRQRSIRRQTREQQWYSIFEIVFPGYSPLPKTPYNDFTLLEQSPLDESFQGISVDEGLFIPHSFVTGENLEVLEQAMANDPESSHLSRETIRTALHCFLRVFRNTNPSHHSVRLSPPSGSQSTMSEQMLNTGGQVSQQSPQQHLGPGAHDPLEPDGEGGNVDQQASDLVDQSSVVVPPDAFWDADDDIGSSYEWLVGDLVFGEPYPEVGLISDQTETRQADPNGRALDSHYLVLSPIANDSSEATGDFVDTDSLFS